MINCNTAIKIKDALDNKPFKTMFAFATNDVAEARGKLRSKKSRTNRQNDETAGSRLPASTRNTDRISSTPEVNNNKSLEYASPRKYFFHQLEEARGYSIELLSTRQSPRFQQDVSSSSSSNLERDFASHGMAMEMGVRRSKLDFLRRAIVDCGLSPNARNPGRSGSTLLHIACKRGKQDVFDLLLELGKRWKVVDGQGRTLMHEACRAIFPAFSIMQCLLKLDCSMLFLKDDLGKTPLDYVHVEDWKQWKEWIEDHLLTDHCFPSIWSPLLKRNQEGESVSFPLVSVWEVCGGGVCPPHHYFLRRPQDAKSKIISSSCDEGRQSSRQLLLSLEDMKMIAQGKFSIAQVLGEEEEPSSTAMLEERNKKPEQMIKRKILLKNTASGGKVSMGNYGWGDENPQDEQEQEQEPTIEISRSFLLEAGGDDMKKTNCEDSEEEEHEISARMVQHQCQQPVIACLDRTSFCSSRGAATEADTAGRNHTRASFCSTLSTSTKGSCHSTLLEEEQGWTDDEGDCEYAISAVSALMARAARIGD